MNEAPGLEKESRYEQKQKESSGSFSGNRNGSCYGNSAGERYGFTLGTFKKGSRPLFCSG